MTALPKISFGIIVLNGEPFLRYNLRTLYPFAHQIIIAEGASPKAAHAATPDGHSTDSTLETIRRFQVEDDPEGKVILVTAEDDGHPNGFWPGEKDQQSQAYAKRATGNWLWQIDIDEFYHPRDLQRIIAYLAAYPDTTCLTLRGLNFWGGFDYVIDGGLFTHPRYTGELWGVYRRVFKWGPGYSYITHRPPSVADATGRDITGRRMRFLQKIGDGPPIYVYHYFMVLRSQFLSKGAYYEKQGWGWERGRTEKNQQVLLEVNLQNGLHIMDHHNTRNWIVPFTGEHPPQITALRQDIASGRVTAELRHTHDLDQLVADPHYQQAIARAAREEWLKVTILNLRYLFWYRPRTRMGRLIRQYLPDWLKMRLPTSLRAWLQASR